ncbi:M28 family peptidase [Rhodohalobacter sp. 614A]|uniref:M28 family peptidase n=1 Tax=Rhodohalobacter sp. 614A TaxID=2908649 RepID=UPI001F18F2E8|nr:M28 family peptidase [Rhodohalobacter sp. 614A]
MKKIKIALPVFVIGLFFLMSCGTNEVEQAGDDFLKEHVTWLADEERGGRLVGTINEADAANYISDHFLQYGLIPAGDEGTYVQQFKLEGPMVQAMEIESQISRNVVGLLEGETFPNRYIIVGAHYDGQGMGGTISMNMNSEPALHYSADDNASGTAGLFYLAREFAEHPPQSSVLIVAFSGEELGLIGSKYFVDEMEISPDSVLAMINLDMIGRLENNELDIFGTGTSSQWEKIIASVETDSLEITTTPGGMGSSDHASFYRAEIPVLHYYTGTHQQYHRETDTADLINYAGMEKVLEHVESVVRTLDSMTPGEIDFQESTDPRGNVRMRSGPTLGVMPDYTFSGEGFRIEQVRPDGTADAAGLQDGDIIIEMDGKEVADIYGYMEVLNTLESGDTISITILRDDEEIDLEATF